MQFEFTSIKYPFYLFVLELKIILVANMSHFSFLSKEKKYHFIYSKFKYLSNLRVKIVLPTKFNIEQKYKINLGMLRICTIYNKFDFNMKGCFYFSEINNDTIISFV